jgi:hypothetical protein
MMGGIGGGGGVTYHGTPRKQLQDFRFLLLKGSETTDEWRDCK